VFLVQGRTLQQFIDKKMQKPKFKKCWTNLDNEFELLEEIIKARETTGLTQTELAEKIGTKQPALSRLEKGGIKKATIETLNKIADALDMELIIKLKPRKAA